MTFPEAFDIRVSVTKTYVASLWSLSIDSPCSTWLTAILAAVLWNIRIHSTIAQPYDQMRYGSEADPRFVGDIAEGRDLDGDGVNDFVIGSPHSLSGRGIVTLFSGTGRVLGNIQGNAVGNRFGNAVASPGDLNGDGINDILVGAPGDRDCVLGSGSQGYVVSLLGPSFTTTYYSISGTGFDSFGFSVRVIGDVNNDHVPDFIVGRPTSARQTADLCSLARGGATVYSGRSGKPLYWLPGATYGESFGSVVGSIGDVTSDGIPDFAVATANHRSGTHVNVYSGVEGHLVYSVEGKVDAYDEILPLADINGDHTPDFLVSSKGTRSSVRAISGRDGSSIYLSSCSHINGPSTTLLLPMHDLNDDNMPEFATTSFQVTNQQDVTVRICSGATGDTLRTQSEPLPMATDLYGNMWRHLVGATTLIAKN